MRTALWSMVLGCQPGTPVEQTHRLEAEHVVFSAAAPGLVVHARQASLDDDGSGTATTVQAELPGLAIESSTSHWDFRAQRAVFEGDVRATRGDTTLHCATLSVQFGNGEQIQSALATGSVVLSTGNRRATAAEAALDGATGRVLLEGSPEITEGGRRLQGQSITLWLDDDRLDCQQCTLVMQGDAIGQP